MQRPVALHADDPIGNDEMRGTRESATKEFRQYSAPDQLLFFKSNE
jgi:hypothetical protein